MNDNRAETGTLLGGTDLTPIRGYLMHLAERQIGEELHAKGGASDLVQTTLLVAHRSRDQYRGQTEDQLRGWLVKILQNVARRFRRYWRAQGRSAGREVSLEGAEGGGEAAHLDTPSRNAVCEEQQRRLAEAVATLPLEMRQVVSWRTEEQLTFGEIGARLGKGEDAARMVYHRALERLRQLLDDGAA